MRRTYFCSWSMPVVELSSAMSGHCEGPNSWGVGESQTDVIHGGLPLYLCSIIFVLLYGLQSLSIYLSVLLFFCLSINVCLSLLNIIVINVNIIVILYVLLHSATNLLPNKINIPIIVSTIICTNIYQLYSSLATFCDSMNTNHRVSLTFASRCQ